MRIQVTFGIDPDELPAFNAFIASASAARTARIKAEYAAEDAGADASQTTIITQVALTGVESVGGGGGGGVDKVVFGEEDVASATLALANKKGVGAASAVLSQFNVVRARDLKPEQRAEYITAAKAAEAVA